MANKLTTRFVFQDTDGKKIDALRGKLVDFNDYANKSGSANFGKTIGLEAEKGSSALGKLGKEVDSLKTKTETISARPTISRFWENEAAEVKKSVEKIKTTTDSINAKSAPLDNPGQASFKRIGEYNKPDFGKPDYSLYKDIEKARIEVQKLNSTKLNSGQIDGLTKAGVRLQTELTKTSNTVNKLNAALRKTSDKDVIEILNYELITAQSNFDKLLSKQKRFEAAQGGISAAGGDGKKSGSGANNLKLSSFQKQNLSYQVNDVLTGLASGQNPSQILAQQGGQIAQIFNPAQIKAYTAAYSGLVTILGAGAIAIAATYKITGDIRAEAERLLKVEEKITAERNKQFLSQKEASEKLRESRRQAASDFAFNQNLPNASLEDLTRQRDLLLKLSENRTENPLITARILELEARMRQLPLDKQKSADAAFNARNETFKKNQEDAREAESRRIEELKKRQDDIKKGTDRARELGKQYNSVFDSLQAKRVADNPIASVFLDGQKALESLKESIRGLSPELAAQAIAMQRELNANSLFSASLDNKLSALNLRDEADDFRNFKSPVIKDTGKFFEEYIEFYAKKLETDFSKTTARYAADSTFGGNIRVNQNPFARINRVSNADGTFGGFSQSDRRNDLFYSYDRVEGGLGGFSRRTRSFTDLTQREKDDFIRSSSDADGKDLKFQQRLDRQILAASNSDALTEDQRRIVDRKIISLTQGIDPSKLTEQQRDIAGSVREREAERIERNTAEARQRDTERNEYLRRVAESNEKLIELARKGGSAAIEQIVRIVDETGGAVEIQQRRPTPADTAAAYGEYQNAL